MPGPGVGYLSESQRLSVILSPSTSVKSEAAARGSEDTACFCLLSLLYAEKGVRENLPYG
jgi:hypothetical protein